jgi:hypothetical protein
MSGIAPLRATRLARWACILIIAFCGSNGYAQEQQPSSYEGLEGRPVTKVDISAFRALLALNAGESFSVQSMRDSVNALQKTRLVCEFYLSFSQHRMLETVRLSSEGGNTQGRALPRRMDKPLPIVLSRSGTSIIDASSKLERRPQ